MYYNNMRNSGLPLFVSLFPNSSPTTRSQTYGYVTCVAVNVPGVPSVLHELRDLAKATQKVALRHRHVKTVQEMQPHKKLYNFEVSQRMPFPF
jgi:hypothetical protein